MVSDKFRQQLRREATQWRSDGLISSEVYDQLAERYDFTSIDERGRDRFVAVLVVIGSVLLGISVITFVAANWQAIPRSLKVVLLLSVLIAFNTVGFYLWRSPLPSTSSTSNAIAPKASRRPSHWRQRLGHGLLICGALCFGANIALMGQLFHQQGTAFGFCLIWSLGVVTMAYGLNLASLASLSIGLLVGGYWFNAYDADSLTGIVRLVFDAMPLLTLAVFLPLAYRCRSRVVFGGVAIGVGVSLGLTLNRIESSISDPFRIIFVLSMIIPAALWWAYDDRIWSIMGSWVRPGDQAPTAAIAQNRFDDSETDTSETDDSETHDSQTVEKTPTFRPIGRSLCVIYLSGLFYFLSFHYAWLRSQIPFSTSREALVEVVWALATNPNIVVLLIATLALWIWLGWPRIANQWRLTTTDVVIFAMLIMTGLVPIWDAAIAPVPILATFIFNLLLFLMAIGLMREGIDDGDRRQFWFGLVLLIVQIMSRVFEYETGLLLKSFAFLLCGVGIILIGLWFERHIRPVHPSSSASVAPRD
jgi:uncharacterized membrane protein